MNNFPRVSYKDRKKLYDLHDILTEIMSTKEDPKYERLLAYFDTSAGVNPVITKLPPTVQSKWRDRASNYKTRKGSVFPPFTFFVEFIAETAKKLNDPGFDFDTSVPNTPSRDVKPHGYQKSKVHVSKTTVQPNTPSLKCIIHKSNHSLNECRAFRLKSIEDRRKLLKENGICFKCLVSKDHLSRDCKDTICCKECQSVRHNTGMHFDRPVENHGGERGNVLDTSVTTACTEFVKVTFLENRAPRSYPFTSQAKNFR